MNYKLFQTKTVIRFLVLTIFESYRSNITRALKQTFYISYVLTRKAETVYK